MKKTWILFCLLPLFCGVKAQPGAQISLDFDEIQVFEAHAGEVEQRGIFNAREKTTELLMQYRVPRELRNQLYQWVLNRETKKVIYDYQYPDSVYKRVQSKQLADQECADSIDRILIPYNDISGPNLRIALEYPQDLHLKPKQYEVIMSRALAMRKERLKNPTVNLWEREFELLDSVLTKKQMRSFFVTKYAYVITDIMHQSWEKLKANALDQELDSTQACAQIYMYNLSLYQINDLFKYNPAKRQAAVKTLDAKAPRAIQLLQGLRRKEQAEEAFLAKEKNKKKKEEKGNLFW